MGVQSIYRSVNGKRTLTGYRAQHRPTGKSKQWLDRCFPPTKDGKKDAEVAYEEAKAAIRKGYSFNNRVAKASTVGGLIEKFRTTVVARRKKPKTDNNRCLSFMAWEFAQKDLTNSKEIQYALQRWRDARLAGYDARGKPCRPVTHDTVNRDLGIIGPMFDLAIAEWEEAANLVGNPAHMMIRPPAENNHREELWSDDELHEFLDHLQFVFDKNPAPSGQFGQRHDAIAGYFGWVVVLMRYTGLRLGNCMTLKLGWIDLPKRVIHFPKNELKNKERWDCPLSDAAIGYIEKLLAYRLEAMECTLSEARMDPLIPAPVDSMTGMLARRQKELAKTNPRFAELVRHDMRHTFTTELVEKYGITDLLTLADMTGRKDWDVLKTYIHRSATNMSHQLSGRKPGEAPPANAPKWTPPARFTRRAQLHVVEAA